MMEWWRSASTSRVVLSLTIALAGVLGAIGSEESRTPPKAFVHNSTFSRSLAEHPLVVQLLFMAADENFDERVTREEWERYMLALDSDLDRIGYWSDIANSFNETLTMRPPQYASGRLTTVTTAAQNVEDFPVSLVDIGDMFNVLRDGADHGSDEVSVPGREDLKLENYEKRATTVKNFRAAELAARCADAFGDNNGNITEDELKVVFDKLDGNKDGYAGLSEMEAIMLKPILDEETAPLDKLLHSMTEALCLTAYDSESYGLPQVDFLRLVSLLDEDKDGQVSIEGLRQMRAESFC